MNILYCRCDNIQIRMDLFLLIGNKIHKIWVYLKINGALTWQCKPFP